MKNSFKYSILLLLLSFLIATLCCSSHGVLERYTEYPFTDSSDNDDLHSLANLQKTLFKYNQVVAEKDYDISNVIQDINLDRGKIKYERLRETQPEYGNYRPFDAYILSDEYRPKKITSKVKGKRTIIDPGKTKSLDIQNLEPQVSGGLGTTQSVKETSISGDFYYEEHACEGGWSDWNKSHCGLDRERCGIMFKKYEIVEIEKNEPGPNGEPRPGKPCEYKDGMIKYKYCLGENADDYDSNIERCNLSTNVCACQLKDPTLLDGETVYELADDTCLFELQRDCLCPNGYSNMNIGDICKLDPGVDCSVEEPGCIYTAPSTNVDEKCEIPPFLNQTMEDDFFSSYSEIDGKCKEKKCTCSNGTPGESNKCVIDGEEICNKLKPCNVGYFMSGNPPTCKKHSEGLDVYKECSCLYGSPRIEDMNELRCSPENSEHSELLGQGIQRQHCSAICSTGYKQVQDPNECNIYYPSTSFDNVSCCIPEFDKCTLEESDLDEKNIIRKDPTSPHSILNRMKLSELKDKYDSIGSPIDLVELIEQENPKEYLINTIIQETPDTSDTTSSSCSGNIYIDECYSEFKCNPGYAFLPNRDYSSEYELRITSCSKNEQTPPINLCKAVNRIDHTSCTSPNAGILSYESSSSSLTTEDGTACLFPSNLTDEEVTRFLTKYNITDTIDITGIRCDGIVGTECSELCQPEQIFTYNPVWNGTCVPVSCTISEEIKNIYNIPYDNCPSENMNCGLNNVTCKNASFEVNNSRKSLYCRSPQKVDSDYMTRDYPLIDIGCSSNPPQRTSAEERRRERMTSSGEIIQGDASEQVSGREGPIEENIGQRADFTGTTSEPQLELEIGLLERRGDVEEQLEERTAPLASQVGSSP